MKMHMGESVKKLLKTEVLGKAIYFFEEVGSTNEIAFELARNGAPHGTLVIADSQTKGRGRLQRKWISPPGVNLYMSVIFRPRIVAKDVPLLTLVSSIALVEAIKVEGTGALIKWPNDVLINGKKVAGILTEMQPEGDKVEFVIVGIGVNINMSREMMKTEMIEVAETATSIREEVGHEIDRVKFTANLIKELEIWYQKFIEDGKSLIIKEWTERFGAINRRIKVIFNGDEIQGIAQGIDENGYLIVRKDDGATEKIIAGDVILL